ncbi:MAG: DUF2795 domain-containing protein [Actinomycetes bacterium]
MDPVDIRHRVREALNSVDFPASKEQLVDCVQGHADEDVVRAVRGLPLAEYANYDEVLRSVHTPGRSADRPEDDAG